MVINFPFLRPGLLARFYSRHGIILALTVMLSICLSNGNDASAAPVRVSESNLPQFHKVLGTPYVCFSPRPLSKNVHHLGQLNRSIIRVGAIWNKKHASQLRRTLRANALSAYRSLRRFRSSSTRYAKALRQYIDAVNKLQQLETAADECANLTAQGCLRGYIYSPERRRCEPPNRSSSDSSAPLSSSSVSSSEASSAASESATDSAASSSSSSTSSASNSSNSAPDVPGGLTAEKLGSGTDVIVTWRDVNNEVGYSLERQIMTAPGNWSALGSIQLAHDVSIYVHSDLVVGNTYRYRISAFNEIGFSSPSEWVSLTLSDQSNGWTEVSPQPESRQIYVSWSSGNDANSGLSASSPKKTLAAGAALLRDGSPDWLYLKRGDTWPMGFGQWKYGRGGPSAEKPTVITAYGEGNQRPLLATGLEGGFEFSGGGGTPPRIENLYIIGIAMRASRASDPKSQSAGIALLRPGHNFLAEDLYIEGYKDNFNIQGDSLSDPFTNLRIRRSVVVDAFCRESDGGHSQGLFASNVRNLLLEDNLFDHNGYHDTIPGAEATMFNHALYLSGYGTDDVTMRGNLILRSSSHGVNLNRAGIITDNYFGRNAVGILARTVASTAFPQSTVTNNVILESRDITPVEPRSFGIIAGNFWDPVGGLNRGPLVIDGNIIAHRTSRGGNSAITVGGANTTPVTRSITNNIVYDWRTANLEFEGSLVPANERLVLASNNFQDPVHTDYLLLASARLQSFLELSVSQNTYFHAAPISKFMLNTTGYDTFANWELISNEWGGTFRQASYKDANRNLATYMTFLGLGNSFEDFVAEARKQSRINWREFLTAKAVNAYIRDGFSDR